MFMEKYFPTYCTSSLLPLIVIFNIFLTPLSTNAQEIIVDNTAAQRIGFWMNSTSAPNFFGTNFTTNISSARGADKLVWRPVLPQDGDYEVYYWLPNGSSSRATDAQYTVFFAGGSNTYTVNQEITPGGQWILLGTHSFVAGTSGYVELNDSNNGFYTVGDALRFVRIDPSLPPPPPAMVHANPGNGQVTVHWDPVSPADGYNLKYGPTCTDLSTLIDAGDHTSHTVTGLANEEELCFAVSSYNSNGTGSDSATVTAVPTADIIVDNIEAELTGNWSASTSLPHFYQDNYLVSLSGNGSDNVRWRPSIPEEGNYDIYYWLPDGLSSRSTNALYSVHFSGGTQNYFVNQQTSPGGTWEFLGSHRFAAGSSGYVELNDSNNGRWTIADAVRLVPQEDELDTTPPFVSEIIPADGVINVAVDTDIEIQLSDNGSGVDLASVLLAVNGTIIYDGSNPGAFPNTAVIGDPSEFTFFYNPPDDFDSSQDVIVTAQGSDLAGNPLSEPNTFTFTTSACLPDDCVEQGKNKLLNDFDFLGALELFNLALEVEPEHPKAIFWQALVLPFSNSDFLELLNNLGITDADNRLLFDEEGHANIDLTGPLPTIPEMRSTADSLLTELNQALDGLSSLDETFLDTITGGSQLGPEEFVLDFGEVRAVTTAFYYLKHWIHMLASYNADSLDTTAFLTNPPENLEDFLTILDADPDLLTLLPAAGARLAQAKTALRNTADSYLQSSTFIRSREDDDGLNHILRIYDLFDPQIHDSLEAWEALKQASLEIEQFFRNMFSNLLDHLDDPLNHPLYTVNFNNLDDVDNDLPGQFMTVDVNTFYDNPIDVRSFLNNLLNGPLVLDSLTETELGSTMGGFLPLLTPADWNFLFGNGPNLNDQPRVVWDNLIDLIDTPSIEVFWEQVVPELAPAFDRYEIYRSETPEVSSASELLSVLTDIDVTSITDHSIDPENDKYYYRIFTYFAFNDGETAASYSDRGNAVLRLFIDNNSASDDEDGSRDQPFKNFLPDLWGSVGRGTRVLVAEGNYEVGINNLWNINQGELFLQGGYQTVTWQRDIENFATILNAGPLNMPLIFLYETSDVFIEGFTLTGSSSSGVALFNSSRIIIKNCRIINNAFEGILLQQSFLVDLYNNLINGNQDSGLRMTFNGADYTIHNNVIVNNGGSGGIELDDSVSDANIQNNIIGSNNAEPFNQGLSCNGNQTTVINFNDVFNHNNGEIVNCNSTTGQDGNISADPLFVDPGLNDYHPQGGSPVIDAGNPDPAFNDSLSPPGLGTVRNDMGIYGGPFNQF